MEAEKAHRLLVYVRRRQAAVPRRKHPHRARERKLKSILPSCFSETKNAILRVAHRQQLRDDATRAVAVSPNDLSVL